MNVYLPNLRLPSAYQEVEYIECTGTQWINTGYKPNYNTKFYSKSANNEHIMNTPLFGVRESNQGLHDYTVWQHPSEYSNGNDTKTAVLFNSAYNSGTIPAGMVMLNNYPQGQAVELEYDKNGGKYGTQTWTWTTSSYTSPYDLYLFARNNYGTLDSRLYSGKLWYMKIEESGTLVRDFVPCYRKSDNVIGLYDLVNNQFYTNSGTGTFSKGNDVTMVELKNAYIGEYREWTPNDHTLLYLPLESDVVDRSGKSGRTFGTNSLTYTTVGGVQSVHVGTSGGILLTAPKPIVTPSVSKQTISILTYVTSQQTSARRIILEWRVQNNVGTVLAFEGGTTEIRAFGDSVGDTVSANIIANQRMHIVLTNCSEGKKLYLNGQLVSTGAGVSSPRGSWAYSYTQNQGIFCRRDGDYGGGSSMNGNARELIAEDTIWSAEDVSNYYQRIKAKLGF